MITSSSSQFDAVTNITFPAATCVCCVGAWRGSSRTLTACSARRFHTHERRPAGRPGHAHQPISLRRRWMSRATNHQRDTSSLRTLVSRADGQDDALPAGLYPSLAHRSSTSSGKQGAGHEASDTCVCAAALAHDTDLLSCTTSSPHRFALEPVCRFLRWKFLALY